MQFYSLESSLVELTKWQIVRAAAKRKPYVPSTYLPIIFKLRFNPRNIAIMQPCCDVLRDLDWSNTRDITILLASLFRSHCPDFGSGSFSFIARSAHILLMLIAPSHLQNTTSFKVVLVAGNEAKF